MIATYNIVLLVIGQLKQMYFQQSFEWWKRFSSTKLGPPLKTFEHMIWLSLFLVIFVLTLDFENGVMVDRDEEVQWDIKVLSNEKIWKYLNEYFTGSFWVTGCQCTSCKTGFMVSYLHARSTTLTSMLPLCPLGLWGIVITSICLFVCFSAWSHF